ncbi:HET-domain-containing protein [Didymella exigua CBS 183.55]|uniref:HET-domain-containing protein n=1 Tax=Didymella exigua CBS 183.55 TaxID=1150837 RepID=A0A6A5RPX5_9PLEO|nr:HET-domain-containing protein [Didymella exigua CBS 183.55]KAF1929370.1 HET-domain-containing protein [Didymella exigua CBS 183.55]
MRLLSTNTKTLRLHEFPTDIPEYVILSHTWLDAGEVQFEDIEKPEVHNLPGYSKLLAACRQAMNDGFEWIWIDTCCINKNSSAELSEAINSMYSWYWQAEICYAYLVDVPANEDHTTPKSSFAKSRWWTRGWTLQELLAPAILEFYDSKWNRIGTKSSLIKSITAVTNIEERHLLNRETIHESTIAAIFSWASTRKTTRVEDIAYCLLGLVRVNIPLLYGEGSRAFYRLQLELLNQTAEHTIFAWDPMTNRGLRISLPRLPYQQSDGDFIAILNCRRGKGEFVGIKLKYISREQYCRVPGSRTILLTSNEVFGNYPYTIYIPAESRLRTGILKSRNRKPS